MSAIVDLSVPRSSFELGRILPPVEGVEYTLETIVPLGEAPIPFLRVHDGQADTLVDVVTAHPAVREMTLQTTVDGEEVYSLDWVYENDELVLAVLEYGGHIISGDSYGGQWQFTLAFPDHESVTKFHESLQEQGVENDVLAVSNQWDPGDDSVSGPSRAQQEALQVAYKAGYYDIPRRASTNQIAKELGISDQAVSERLRRGTGRLIETVIPIVKD